MTSALSPRSIAASTASRGSSVSADRAFGASLARRSEHRVGDGQDRASPKPGLRRSDSGQGVAQRLSDGRVVRHEEAAREALLAVRLPRYLHQDTAIVVADEEVGPLLTADRRRQVARDEVVLAP